MGCVSGGGHRGQGAAGVERWLQCNSVPDTWQLDTEWHFLCWQSRCPVASGPHMWRLDTSLFCEYWPMDQDDLQMYSIKASFSFVPISRHEWDQFYTEDKILQHYRWAKSEQFSKSRGDFVPFLPPTSPCCAAVCQLEVLMPLHPGGECHRRPGPGLSLVCCHKNIWSGHFCMNNVMC